MNCPQFKLAVREPTFMYKAGAVCNQLGLDGDAAGGAIGWAMECYQRGIIDEKDTDGLKLCWGDAGVALELIRRIGHREGFGNILGEGCARASDIIGRDSSYYALNIKGQDYDGKAKMVKYMEVLHRVCNSFGVCEFNTTYWDVEMIDLPQLAELYSSATGWPTSVKDFEKAAMKQLNLEKAFNLRHTNFDRKDDMPTPRDLNEPIPTGDLAG